MLQTTPHANAPDVRIRKISWRDWRKLTELFPMIFPELTPRQIADDILLYEDTAVVAEDARGLVGFYFFIPKAETGTAWLNYFGVTPSCYQSGIAPRLLRDYEQRALRMGYFKSELDVFQQNPRAIRFYEKHGYAHVSPLKDKLRYRKALTVDVAPVGSPQPTRMRPRLVRMCRRALYLALVSFSR